MFSHFEFLGRDVPTYAVCAFGGAAAIALYFLVMCRFPKKTVQRTSAEDMFYMLIYAFIGAIIGAKLFYLITSVEVYWYPEYSFVDNMKYWFSLIAGGGLVFYGGLIGAVLGALRYTLHFKLPVSNTIDLGFAGVPLFHAFGRLGCFMAGCCYGTEYHGIFAVTFPEGNLGGAPAGVELLPVQLIEAFANVILWLVLTAVYRRTTRRFLTSGIYLVSYGILRFVLEYFRGDLIRGSIFVFSSSQFISFFIVAAGIFLLVRPKRLDDFGKKNDEIYAAELEKLEQKKRERKAKA